MADAPWKAISTPYNPDDCLGSYGWLWRHEFKGDAKDEEPRDVDLADTWAGSPYIPLNAPACGPHSGALVVVHLPSGASISGLMHQAHQAAPMRGRGP